MQIVAIILGAIAGIVTLVMLYRPFFRDAKGFHECVRFWLTPDLWSMVRGEYGRDVWSELVLLLWLVCGCGVGLSVWYGINTLVT